MKKLIAACAALLAFAAFAAAGVASASPVLTDPHGTLPVGAKIEATNTGSTKMTTSLGTIECSNATLTGTVVKNNGTEIEGTIENAAFNSAGGPCTTAFLGNVTVTPKKLHWCIKAGGKLAADTFELKSGNCGGALGIMEFTLDTAIAGECTYTKTAVIGTFTTGVGGDLTVSEQEFVKSAGGFFCPGSGKLDMTFDLYTDGKEHTPTYQVHVG